MATHFDCEMTGDSAGLRPTPPDVFFDRRSFIRSAVAIGLASGTLACAEDGPVTGATGTSKVDPRVVPPLQWPDGLSPARNDSFPLPAEVGDRLTPRLVAASHNNYYEFLSGRGGDVWPHTKAFKVDPWTVEVTGECMKPQTFDLDALFKMAHEERLYHFRCVERWAMNVPWSGFPLRRLLERVEPKSSAAFVKFLSPHRPEQMPGQMNGSYFPWPYFEGLRMDEAMNELTLCATGVYGEPLPKQHGAPIRIIVPWKYGYKSPKSIVRIELARDQPPTFWTEDSYKHEYGFISNVNPNIPHPRWSQAKSYWLDTREKFATPIFNGYGRFVADLYPDEPRTLQKSLRRGQTAR